MLDAYRKINLSVCSSFGVKYVDLRSAFEKALPLKRLDYKGALTLDGQNLNLNGTKIVAQLFSEGIISSHYNITIFSTRGSIKLTITFSFDQLPFKFEAIDNHLRNFTGDSFVDEEIAYPIGLRRSRNYKKTLFRKSLRNPS